MPLADTVLLLMALLALGVLIRGLFSRLPIPYTVMLVLAGMLLGSLARVWPAFEPIRSFHLSPELVFFIFLPVLIFESGFSLNARQLARDFIPVLVMAIPALLASTTLVGIGVWVLLPLDLTTALLFGALISATDPVAVISLFRELGTPLRLTTLVEGESLFNDATAIVLFTILLGLALHGGFSAGDIGIAVVEFVRVFLGGALLGFCFGIVFSRAVIRLHLEVSSVLKSTVILAYAAFIVAEHGMHLSGVMAVVAAALSFAIFALPRLAEPTAHALHKTWEFLAEITNTLLFLMIGMTVDLKALLAISGFVLLVAVLVVLARAVSVYAFVPLTVRLFKLPAVTMGERHIMWWGGLKGGLAIAIVLSIPSEFPARDLLLNLTLGVVLFSLLVNAPTIRPLISKLGLDRLSADENAELKQMAEQARSTAGAVLQRLLGSRVLSRAGHYQAEQEVSRSLDWRPQPVFADTLERKQRLDTLREQGRELERLFKAGVVPQYSYLDLKNDLQRGRDRIVDPGRGEGLEQAPRGNLFTRFEAALIKGLRESDRASKLLARYQNQRISQHIQKDLVQVLMLEASIDYAQRQIRSDAGFDASILSGCREQLQILHDRIADYQREFGQFYQRFETRFARRAALISVLRHIQDELGKGVISSKVYAEMESAIRRALDRMPPVSEPLPDLQIEEMFGLVPLFSGMPDAALKALAGKAASVSYLEGDVIIGEGEHGDALYIVARGRVRVTRQDGDGEKLLSDLAAGDFFGEMALLGDHVRRASVTARHACTLLRLSAQDVGEISCRFPEVETYLNRLKKEREENAGDG